MTYAQLAVPDESQLLFGRSPRPVECGFGLRVGEGQVYPEVNFTLPAISICEETWGQILSHYEGMVASIIKRATALQVPGLVLEFELLPAMTETPEMGAEITALLHRHLKEAHGKHGLQCALRVTPTDIRDQSKPPELRSGAPWERLKQSFTQCIEAGADIISIESVGGKEIHDPGLMYGDLRSIIFALGVLAPRDMAWLWGEILPLCKASGRVVAGGDSACGFANTAMQLAHQKMLPEVLAAVVRAMSAVRSLVAFECGAIGPSKDCAYEGPVIKAITGCPISMEGKSAACAHFSPLGNIASAMCDLWSNESVQDVRLLSGSAPEAFTEILAYDCRLMNTAAASGGALTLRQWLVDSDESLSPQAVILTPKSTMEIARAIVGADSHYAATLSAGRAAVRLLRHSNEAGALALGRRESTWLERIERELASMPDDEMALLGEMKIAHGNVFRPSSYGLE